MKYCFKTLKISSFLFTQRTTDIIIITIINMAVHTIIITINIQSI